MARLILLVIFFLFSLLVVFRAGTSLLWYLSILATEFSWIFICFVIALLFWKRSSDTTPLVSTVVGITAICLYLQPYIRAATLSKKLQRDFASVYALQPAEKPFELSKLLTGIARKKLVFQTLTYDEQHHLGLDFYPARKSGQRPCVIVIHGGSWAGGNSQQLPELNSELARWGYHVASINYRLAPKDRFPAPVQDVQSAIAFLKKEARTLNIDTTKFVLLGRSAGAQIALSAAYTLDNSSIRAVIDFYGPTDMVWGYQNPTNPLVLNSRRIMEDYLGGSLQQVPGQYLQSSATETVTIKTPPTLMIYAENDPLVSPRHGTKLRPKLEAKKIPFYELYLPWATHGFDYSLNGPGGQLSTWTVKYFLEAILKQP